MTSFLTITTMSYHLYIRKQQISHLFSISFSADEGPGVFSFFCYISAQEINPFAISHVEMSLYSITCVAMSMTALLQPAAFLHDYQSTQYSAPQVWKEATLASSRFGPLAPSPVQALNMEHHSPERAHTCCAHTLPLYKQSVCIHWTLCLPPRTINYVCTMTFFTMVHEYA